MSREEKLCMVAKTLCGIDDINNCIYMKGETCQKVGRCRIKEKTDDQLDYILSSIDTNTYLEACAGSGKTEVLGIKAAYEICRWTSRDSGIAVLSFTNDAADTILDRVMTFYRKPLPSNHFVGTFSSFVHGYIAQKFGYKYYHSREGEKDKSFRLVDSDTSQYDNMWLKNYELDFHFADNIKTYANQLNYHEGSQTWFSVARDKSISVKQRCRSERQYKLLHDKIKECKLNFWKCGFATFEDMNYIARKCLQNSAICNMLAKKFPIIFIDECQDLSKNELCLISSLISAGTKVHYVGDQHQAIYSFKDSMPQYFTAHVSELGFTTLYLNDNFRSSQDIVDVSCTIGNITSSIVGRAFSPLGSSSCFYLEYTDEMEALMLFKQLLAEYGVPIANSAVLIRTQGVKEKISSSNRVYYLKHPIINAIQCWNFNTPNDKQQALNLVGRQLQKWIGFQGNSNNCYYPSGLCSDYVTWRVMLRDILDALVGSFPVADMSGKKYSSWYLANRKRVASIINEYLQSVIGKSIPESIIRTPYGTASDTIALIYPNNAEALKIETIHAAKGKAYDAVMLLSANNSHGKTGYWENWLNADDEASRICYVACTRPRYLLCWGVSRLEDESKRQKLESLGLKQYKK